MCSSGFRFWERRDFQGLGVQGFRGMVYGYIRGLGVRDYGL